MTNPILAADDEDDLCRRKRIFVRLGGVIIACGAIVAQHWHSSFQWSATVAHADSQVENVCALRDDFSKSVGKEDASSVAEGCGIGQEAAHVDVLSEFAQEISAMLSGYPIDSMTVEIAKRDRVTAAFLIGIAKKESDWGKHVPTKDGLDCYNYWGYKGAGGRGSAMGYACFESSEEAVQVVGGRLFTLAHDQYRDTPAKMLVWKCGSSCAGHSSEGIKSWIGTVDMYYQKIVTNNRG